MNRNPNGFTLVELSIVLVIIGLLIGGILVGQSLIDTAKINRAVSTITQIDVAVSLFRDRYKKVPGDAAVGTHPGNANGITDNGEHNYVFEQLYELKILPKNYATTPPDLFKSYGGMSFDAPDVPRLIFGLSSDYTMSIETKMDDGNGESGRMGLLVPSTADCCVPGTGKYLIGGSCWPVGYLMTIAPRLSNTWDCTAV